MFQLTTSRRGRPRVAARTAVTLSCFNSRPHEEVDSFVYVPVRNHECFNSRPHEEVDADPIASTSMADEVSTHDLTKRSTKQTSTNTSIHICFNSRPHEEVDREV